MSDLLNLLADCATGEDARKKGALDKALMALVEDPWMAHSIVFPHRHPDESCDAHMALVGDLWRGEARWNIEGFRGIGKTSLAEEAVLLRCILRLHRNFVIIGSSHTRACDRLGSIKNQCIINPVIEALFGSLVGQPWQEDRILLSNGVFLQAMGRDQSTLGIKWNDARPDGFLIDDVEDPEEKRSDPEREETYRWLIQTFLPSLDHPLRSWGRHLGTRRGVGSLAERLEKSGWGTSRYPIEHLNEAGERTATWPAKFPLPVIDQMKLAYRSDLATYEEEYMCLAGQGGSSRVFTRDMLRCEPRVRSWENVYIMYDPARTVGRKAATTGKAAWSYVGPRIVFWEVRAEEWLPDQIIDDIFGSNELHQPVFVGFEQDGLNQWALQPIRTEMLKRRVTLPLLPIKAPKAKLDFISGLRQYMVNGEMVFAGQPEMFQDALDQFLSFPRGRIDAPNACAYALLLRPGAAIYENFPEEAIAPDLRSAAGSPAYLAANSDGAVVAAALVQRIDGEIRILADWVREGSPAEVCADIHAEAALAADTTMLRSVLEYGSGPDLYKIPIQRTVTSRRGVTWTVPAWHMETYRNVGLVAAIRAVPALAAIGGAAEKGRTLVSDLLSRRRAGRPAVLVSPNARWTLRAFAGGYARAIGNRAIALAEPEAGIYRVLMEGIEAFAAIGSGLDEDEDDAQPFSTTRGGVAYRSALPSAGRP